MQKPTTKPTNPAFGSGPCAKRPGWSPAVFADVPMGRSHRSTVGKAKLKKAIDETKALLKLPSDYLVAIVPASDTGAVEMVMWSMLGPRPVDICHWETYGSDWFTDAAQQLKLDVRNHTVERYGLLPDLSKTNPKHDCIFTFNGTASGVKVPNLDWISNAREGLSICDATSAIFAMDMLPWTKMDVITYSWQKVLGSEGAHGMLILGPRAVARLESHTPAFPLPKIFRMTKGGKLTRDLFDGATINTPSMLCVEDYLDALEWAKSIGGLDGLRAKSLSNFRVLEKFVDAHPWAHFLCENPAHRSNTSVCLTLDLPADGVTKLTKLLEKEGVAYDIGAHPTAPPGLRIWCGSTIDAADLSAMCEWLAWAYEVVKAETQTWTYRICKGF